MMPIDDMVKRFEERLKSQTQASEDRGVEAGDELVRAFETPPRPESGCPVPAPGGAPTYASRALAAEAHAEFGGSAAPVYILHLSDLHIESAEQAQVYGTQLETDLLHELGVQRLGYLVISGDIANRAQEADYRAAFELVRRLMHTFQLSPGQVVAVPGNHDANWDASRKAYRFVHREHLPTPLPVDRVIPAGEAGALLRDDAAYGERFSTFSRHFCTPLYAGQRYPLDYAGQVHIARRPEDGILFLGLNSAWQVDHHFRQRAGIHMPALARALDTLKGQDLSGWLKIALWHHPVTGKEMMDDEFLELLEVHGFQLCLHGHIHEAIEVFHKYDERRGIYVVGAGAFGAPTKENPESRVPLQYNLLAYDPSTRELVIHTRKKEKPNGTWSADARWGDRRAPVPWYHIKI